MVRGVVHIVWFFLALLAAAAPASAADRAVPPKFEVEAYAQAFGVDSATATTHLERQSRGIELREALERRLADQYADLWFDNESGRFMVPVAGDRVDAVAVAAREAGLAGLATPVRVRHSQTDLLAAHERLIEALMPEIRANAAQISLRASDNAVTVTTAPMIDARQRQAVERAVRSEGSAARVAEGKTSEFRVAPASCGTMTIYPHCGRPLRGGVMMADSVTGKTCTMTNWGILGFVRYIITAGHCNDSLPNGQWRAVNYDNGLDEYIGARWDHRANLDGDVSIIAQNPASYWASGPQTPMTVIWGYDEEYAVLATGWPVQNQLVCFSGYNSTGCGIVDAGLHVVTYTSGAVVGNLYKATASFGCVQPGTSGGPVNADWAQYGVVDAVDSACTFYFTGVRRVEQIWGVPVAYQ